MTGRDAAIQQMIRDALDPLLRRIVALETQVTSLETNYNHQVEVIHSRINHMPDTKPEQRIAALECELSRHKGEYHTAMDTVDKRIRNVVACMTYGLDQ